jgi:hypothetical protein
MTNSRTILDLAEHVFAQAEKYRDRAMTLIGDDAGDRIGFMHALAEEHLDWITVETFKREDGMPTEKQVRARKCEIISMTLAANTGLGIDDISVIVVPRKMAERLAAMVKEALGK